jgi:exosome complex exonuclease DIS3/RRP44
VKISLPLTRHAAALKNDDADDSEGEVDDSAGVDAEARIASRLRREETEPGKEKSPTARVVGIVRRNWRTYVAKITLKICAKMALR